ncbi:hypothetical protein F5887DRAFT_917856 [Amanita rubescens]|nr:hypothetical protein F5887DRAFT_917856 [Amanita rubescens]
MTDSTLYLQRAESGEYNRLVDSLRNMGKRAMVNLEYKREFERDMRNGFKMISTDDKQVPFTAWVFGEIAPRAVGTLHQASGNHYIGRHPQYNLINDDTRVKDAFMLKVPTDAPRDLMYLFDYQLTVLNSIRVDDEQLEQENQQNVEAVEWLRPSNPDKAADLMCIYMGPKYIVASSTSTSSGAKRRGRSAKQQRIMVSAPAPVTDSSQSDTTPLTIPTGPSEVKIGALYDPRLLDDYGGPLFNHHQAKLVQRHIVDEDGNLTAPWLEYDKLRTGTVVLMRISLRTYSVPNNYTQKKFYQIYADRVKVLMRSDEPIEHRSIRLSIDDHTSHERNKETDSDNDCLKGFDSVSATNEHGDGSTGSSSSTASSTNASSSSPTKHAKTSSKKNGKKREIDNMNLD